MKEENKTEEKKKFCMFLDIETGGLISNVHGICEIGFLVFNTDTNEIVSKSVVKIKPYLVNVTENKKAEYTEGAFKVNGHSVDDLEKNGFTIQSVLRLFDEVIKKFEIVYFGGHNLENFDIKFLDHVYRVYLKKPFAYSQLICTLAMARKRLDLKSNSLVNVCKHFNLEPKNYHTAMADTEASYEVFQLLRNIQIKNVK